MTSRRTFIRLVPATAAALIVIRPAQAAMLDDKDPQAAALGYVADASKADKSKYPNYAAGQNCAGCQLYQGKAGAEAGPCALFAGKEVHAKGWCSAFAKKA